LDAVAAGGAQVAKDDFRGMLQCQVDSTLTVLGVKKRPAPFGQPRRQLPAQSLIVVNDQYFFHGGTIILIFYPQKDKLWLTLSGQTVKSQ
jgi:hypothetical protein